MFANPSKFDTQRFREKMLITHSTFRVNDRTISS